MMGDDLPARTCTKCKESKPGQSFSSKEATVCRACIDRAKKTIRSKRLKPEPEAWTLDGSTENWWKRLASQGKAISRRTRVGFLSQ